MAEFSPFQKKVIQRYYDNRESIALQRLGELISELYLVTDEKKEDKLWARARQEMTVLNVPEKIASHVIGQRDVKILAANLQEWSKK